MESTDPAPAFLRTHPQLVDHRQHGLSTHTTLGSVRPVANRGKGRLDRVRRPDVHPVLHREVVEGQQSLPVLLQASNRLRVLGLVRLVRRQLSWPVWRQL